MNSLDLALVVIIGLAAWGGWKKGLFVELASLIGVLAGFFGAVYFSGYAGNWLESSLDWEQKYISLSAFAITFLIILIAIQMAGKVLTKIANFAALGIVNKLLGAVFGGLKMVFILSVALMWFNNWGLSGFILSEDRKEDSILYANIEPIAPAIFPDLIKDAQQIIDDTKKDLHLHDAH